MILRMGVEVAGEFADPPGQQSDLNLGGSGIAFLALIFFDDFLFYFSGNQSVSPSSGLSRTVLAVIRRPVCATGSD